MNSIYPSQSTPEKYVPARMMHLGNMFFLKVRTIKSLNPVYCFIIKCINTLV